MILYAPVIVTEMGYIVGDGWRHKRGGGREPWISRLHGVCRSFECL